MYSTLAVSFVLSILKLLCFEYAWYVANATELTKFTVVYSAERSAILKNPVDATACLNSTATFHCSTNGSNLAWRLNGTAANGFKELAPNQTYLRPGVEGILFVPGIHKFQNTNITCLGGSSDEYTISDSAQLYVQGYC